MASLKKLQQIVQEIYDQMYSETTPKGNLNEIAESGEGLTDNWFMNYYLPAKRQEEIIEEIISKYKLTKKEKRDISISIHLGYAPRGYQKDE